MTARAVLAGIAVVAMTAGPALAHPPPLGIGGFSGGLLHPLFVPAHAMALLGLGLLIGQQAGWGRVVLVCAAAGLAAGLIVMTRGAVPVLMNEALLGLAGVTGLLLAAAWPLPKAIGYALAVAAGLAVALDSPPEVLSISEANLMLAGTGLGAAMMLLLAALASSRLRGGWRRTGVRIVGSWIAASAILVLVLRFAR